MELRGCDVAQGDMMIGRILTDGRMSARIKCAACAGTQHAPCPASSGCCLQLQAEPRLELRPGHKLQWSGRVNQGLLINGEQWQSVGSVYVSGLLLEAVAA